MDRIEIVFMRSELNAMIGFLQTQGTVHLEQVPLALDEHPGFLHRVHLPEAERRELDALTQLRQLLAETLPLLTRRPAHHQVVGAGAALQQAMGDSPAHEYCAGHIRNWHTSLRRAHRRKLNIEDNILLIESYSNMLRSLLPLLHENHAVLGENAHAMVLEGYSDEGLRGLEARFAKAVGTGCRTVTHSLGRDRDALIVIHHADKGDAVEQIIAAEGVRPVASPDGAVYGNTPVEVMERAGKKLQSLRGELSAIVAAIDEHSSEHGANITAVDQIIANRIRQLSVVDDFAQSSLVGAVQGWVPSDDYAALAAGLKSQFGDRAEIAKLGLHDVELQRVPTKRVNHPLVKPFELVMSMMKPPTYGHFDPTWLVGLSFLIFYGFILGDAGYGLTMITIGFLVKRKWGHIKPLFDGMTILQYMGISGVLFGILYWEFFGNVAEVLFGFPSFLFHRVHYPEISLNIAILFGVIHVPLSLIIGIREGFAHGHAKHAEELLGMLLGLGALFTAVASMAGMFPLGATLGGVLAALLFAAALFYLFKSMGAMGLMGIMEIIGLSANVLSYSRLMALGVAGIAFADIANRMPASATSFGVFLIGLVGAFGVHAFNFCLSAFSPTIHSLRLNVVEFLPKFYHPEGRNYEPFRKDMAW
jgi:V/A-type H+-transporting ATPase subunit I